jgi:hypothetical protein
MQQALDELEKRFRHHPWLKARIEQLRQLADQDRDLMFKKMSCSMLHISRPLIYKQERVQAGRG